MINKKAAVIAGLIMLGLLASLFGGIMVFAYYLISIGFLCIGVLLYILVDMILEEWDDRKSNR